MVPYLFIETPLDLQIPLNLLGGVYLCVYFGQIIFFT